MPPDILNSGILDDHLGMENVDRIECNYETSRSHTPNMNMNDAHMILRPEVCPEVQLVKRSDGSIVCADLLPMQGLGNDLYLDGSGGVPYDEVDVITPESFMLISNYQCFTRRNDNMKWSLSNASQQRGGLRGLAPTLYVVSPRDMVIVRVRDVNDRIRVALDHSDLKLAVDIALQDRISLRSYQYFDLVKAYIDQLLFKGESDKAAKECSRLLGDDPMMWESMIFVFANKKMLTCIAPYVPTSDPRLPESVYEVRYGLCCVVISHL